MLADRSPASHHLTSDATAQSGLKETQVIVSHNGREVAVYPRWYEICLEGEKEPEIKPGGEKAWWDDFVLNVSSHSPELPSRNSSL